MVRISYLMFAYCREQSVVVHGGFTRSCGMCTPLQSKSIQNSRVLGYGQLNGHVASIVSMFSKRMFCFSKNNVVPGRYSKRNYVPGRYRWWKAGSCFYKKFCKEKHSLLKMIFNKTLLICDIYKRNYTYLLKYLFQQRYRYVVNHDEFFIHHG